MSLGKLSAAIAGSNQVDRAALRTALQNTGLLEAVFEWVQPPGAPWHLTAADRVPEVVLLDLPQQAEIAFSFAHELRHSRPSVRIIACAAKSEPDSHLLLQAMRAGIQDFLNKPVRLEALRETLERFLKDRDGEARVDSSKVTLVMGAKGGVGT
ncbi:MAG: response regulator, partial [Terriglobia bacterium]